MQKTYQAQLRVTVTGDNVEEISRRLNDFMRSICFMEISKEGISNVSITDDIQIAGDGVEEQSGLTVDEIIKSCADTHQLSISEAVEIRKRFNQGCIDNPGCNWSIVVEILADEIIDNRIN